MQLRHHPKLRGRWPPKRSVSGEYAGADPRITIVELAESAVVHRIADCPPHPLPTSPQGVILYTDRGNGVIVTPDALFREQLFHKLQACLGWSVREIGDVEIDF